MRAAAVTMLALACGCGPRVLDDGGGASSEGTTSVSTTATTTSAGSSATTATTNATSATTTTTSSDTSGSGSTSSDTIDPDGEGEGSCMFICRPDWCSVDCDGFCDLWAQDCPRGEKCNPWANDGGSNWNSTKCVPVDPNPKQPGEPCTVEGSGVSGIDDCDVGSMCFWVDPETNTGTCVGMCTGSEVDPQCADGCDTCLLANEGVLILCLDSCHPLVQDCAEGFGCFPSPAGAAFVCMQEIATLPALGEPCTNECAAGGLCMAPEQVPGCAGMTGCCAPMCDVNAADPCPSAEATCLPYWIEAPMNACVAWGNVGVCVEGA
jgi:hypothetical protein